MEPKITVVAAIDEGLWKITGTCLRVVDGEWFSNWAQECLELRGYTVVARVNDQIGANAILRIDMTTGSAMDTDLALAMVEDLPPIKVTSIALVESDEWEDQREVVYSTLAPEDARWLNAHVQKDGYDLVIPDTSGVFPDSCMIRYKIEDGHRRYAFVKIEEIEQPKAGDAIPLIADYHAMFQTFERDARIYANALRRARAGEEMTQREEDMHSFITRVNVMAGCMTTMEEITTLREVLGLAAANLSHAQTIIDGDEDLEEVSTKA